MSWDGGKEALWSLTKQADPYSKWPKLTNQGVSVDPFIGLWVVDGFPVFL